MGNAVPGDNEEAADHGSFWIATTPDRPRRGTLTQTNSGWELKAEGSLYDLEDGRPVVKDLGDHQVVTFPTDPVLDVRDSAPRVVHGHLDDGRKLTFFDAHHHGRSGPFLASSDEHIWTVRGLRVLWGAHLAGLDTAVSAVRWQTPSFRPLSEGSAVKCAEGSLSAWTSDTGHGLLLELTDEGTVESAAEYAVHRINQLAAIATGLTVEPLRREVYVIGDGWRDFSSVLRDTPSTMTSDLLPSEDLTVPLFARWADLSIRLGPLAFLSSRPRGTLQPDALVLAVTLEGLHRRLQFNDRPFASVSNTGLRRAKRAAVAAGVAQLAKEGWQNEAFSASRFQNALGFVGQNTYSERLHALLQPVSALAAGLFGPSLADWIGHMKAVRNVQSHQLLDHDDFHTQEVDLYYVLTESAAWAYRLAIMLQLVPAASLKESLHASSRFSCSLANIDLTGFWHEFSCSQAFRDTRDVGSRPQP